MTLSLVIALVGCCLIIATQYMTIRKIKAQHRTAVDTFLDRMQEIMRELSLLKGQNEGFKYTQQLMREAMSILSARNVALPQTVAAKRKRRKALTTPETIPPVQEEAEHEQAE